MGIRGMEPFTAPQRRAQNIESSRKADSKKTTTTNTNKDDEELQNLRNDVLLLKEMMFKEGEEKQALKDSHQATIRKECRWFSLIHT
jgi:hypothetical protein